jgi:hypothetical protein
MRPHRSRFQLGTTVCVQIGEAIVYPIRRHQSGSRRLIRYAASSARETVKRTEQLRTGEREVPPELSALKDEIAAMVGGLTGAAEDLQETPRSQRHVTARRQSRSPAVG